MSTASVAVIVSVVSAGVTLGGLFWQVTLYRLSGARLKVELLFFYYDSARTLRHTQGSKRQKWTEVADRPYPPAPVGVECAEVRVTNVGRSPVSVDTIALDLGRIRWHRSGRQSVAFRQFRLKDARNPALRESSDGPARLEPGDATARVFHLWPQLTGQIDVVGGKTRVRGTAHAVGRRRHVRSPRRFGWQFESGANTWYRDFEVTPELRLYRTLWYQSYLDYVGVMPLTMHEEIAEELKRGATQEDLVNFMRGLDADGTFLLTARHAYEAFHSGEPTPGLAD